MFPFISIETEYALFKNKQARREVLLFLFLSTIYNVLIGIILSLFPFFVFYWVLY